MKKLSFILLIFCCLFFSGCDNDQPILPPDNDPIMPEIITKKEYLSVDDTMFLSIKQYDSLDLFDITIDNKEILSIDEYYKIKALQIGVAKIRVTLKTNSNIFAEKKIEVISKAPSIYISSDKLSKGISSYIGIKNLDELVENSLSDFEFTSSNKLVASLSGNKITAHAIGSTTITATSKKNPLITNTYVLDVVDEFTTCVVYYDKYLGNITSGMKFDLSILGNFNKEDFTWDSSNSEVARVYNNGKIITVGEGITSITLYETKNPKNSAYFTIEVSGSSNIDYIHNFLETAINERGYVESDGNYSKYGEWYKSNPNPWCAMFVSWCWYHAGLSNEIMLKYQGCQAGMDWSVAQGIFHYKKDYKPVSGDIVFFLSSGSSHTGIVVYADNDYVYTIEGNASNKVDFWRWNLNDARITGYSHPNYPTYDGTRADYSYIVSAEEGGRKLWTIVPEKQETE